MNVLRLVLLIGLAAVPAIGQQNSPQQGLPPASCPVTAQRANSRAFTPPQPYPGELVNSFWLGTEKLWTDNPNSGVWDQWRPHPPGHNRVRPLTKKIFWWSVDFDLRRDYPDVEVTARRLDGDASGFRSTEPTNAGESPAVAMVTGIYLPSPGCWEITGKYKNQSLSFVVWVTAGRVKPLE